LFFFPEQDICITEKQMPEICMYSESPKIRTARGLRQSEFTDFQAVLLKFKFKTEKGLINHVNFNSLFIGKESMLNLPKGAVLKNNTKNNNKIQSL
jgi:hypothetical protein